MSNMSCPLFNSDQEKCSTIIALKRVTGSLSVVGCFFMIFSIWLFRKYNVMSQRLILFLSIAAFFDALGYLIGDLTPDGPECDFEAWWLTYFDWTVLMWVSCITFNLYQNVVKQKQTNNLEKFYHLVSWIFPPLVLSVLPFFADTYGPAGAWCWIKHDATVWRFLIWYVPLFVAIIALICVYAYIIVYLRRQLSSWQGNYDPNEQRNIDLAEEDIKALKAYPFIYLVLSIFPLILRIHNAVTVEGDDIFGLWIMTVLTAPLQGAVNAIVFGLDPETRKRLTWSHIQLAWASHFQSSPIREYPTVAGNEALSVNGTSDDYERGVVQRQLSLDRHSYNSLE